MLASSQNSVVSVSRLACLEFSGARSLIPIRKGEASRADAFLRLQAFGGVQKRMVQKQHYTFGDSDLAAERLRLLARVFEPSSRRLLQSLRVTPSALGVDLGSGPGHTTRLLADQVALDRVVGLDQSPKLLERARREHADERVSFAQCDVSVPPFPVPPAAVLYARFLLTHLREPAQVVRAWASAARPNARLILEETAFLRGEHAAFPRYYVLVERMQAHYGQRMYIGQDLEALSASAEWSIESAEIAVSSLPAADMARLHLLNLGTWSSDPYARAHYAADDLQDLSAQLAQIACGESNAPPISCGMGQVVLLRR